MDQPAKILIVLLCALVSSCAVPREGGPTALDGRLWRIEQNTVGRFVYCQAPDCPERTPKTIKTARAAALPSDPVATDQHEVRFALGSARLNRMAVARLNALLPQLKQAETIALRGWTDPVSGRHSKVNQRLSARRVSAVKNWLVRQGIAHSTISTDSQPPCCNRDATASSPDSIRRQMRVVSIEAR